MDSISAIQLSDPSDRRIIGDAQQGAPLVFQRANPRGVCLQRVPLAREPRTQAAVAASD